MTGFNNFRVEAATSEVRKTIIHLDLTNVKIPESHEVELELYTRSDLPYRRIKLPSRIFSESLEF